MWSLHMSAKSQSDPDQAPAKSIKPNTPPPTQQLTTYAELKKRRMCESCSKPCWVVTPQYPEAGKHLPLGETTLQMWADAIVSNSSYNSNLHLPSFQSIPSAKASYTFPGPDLAEAIIRWHAEIQQNKAVKKARQSIIKAQNTPSRFSYSFHRPNLSHPPNLATPARPAVKRSAEESDMTHKDDTTTLPVSLEEWLQSLDQAPGRCMQSFRFASLYDQFEAQGIDTLEVFNELGREMLIHNFGLLLGTALKLLKWAKDDLAVVT